MQYNIKNTRQLAQILQELRTIEGLTQKAIASKSRLLQKTISALENTPEKCSVESLFRLLSVLDVNIILQPRKDIPKQPETAEW